MGKKLTTEDFIVRAKLIHGDIYDYSLVKYVNATEKVKIICSIHGIFHQKPQKHYTLGRGCWDCGKKSCADKNRNSTEDFIKNAEKVHSGEYDYSKVLYIDNNTKVSIICKIHGEFEQVPGSHLQGTKCKKCSYINSGIQTRVGREHILLRFFKKHGSFYTYYLSEDTLTKDSITIGCPLHGEFNQVVAKHYNDGCPKCGDLRTTEAKRRIPIELSRVVRNIRCRIKGFIKNEGYRKTSPTSEIIGIDWEGLKTYLESNDYGFKVGCSDLDIDHIIPLASVKEEVDVYILNHYTNLQLLPLKYNRFVKGENIFDKKDFEDWLEYTDYKLC